MAIDPRHDPQPVFAQPTPWPTPGRWLLLALAALSLSSFLFT